MTKRIEGGGFQRAGGWCKPAAETFKDDAIISDYAKKAVYSLREKNIINGYNNEFSPDGLLSRAEAAQIISNMLSKI